MDLLESVFNHLVLPPKLPGKQDEDLEAIENSILKRLLDACVDFQNANGQPYAETWAAIRRSLITCKQLNSGRLDKASMLNAFSKIRSNYPLILYIREQNAALTIRTQHKNGTKSVIFEVFEVSPSSENVLAAENTIQWDFPGRAAQIPADEFHNKSFQENLATFLEQASMESLKRFEARSTKADTLVIEARDTTDPALISQMLMPLLEGVGAPVDVPRLRKRVRDDVNIEKAELPWRRLPFWLILRVTIQQQLSLALGKESGRACYKFMICVVLARLLKDCAGHLTPELTMLLKAKLCRRLAKLELDKTHVSASCTTYKSLFDSMGPLLKETVEVVNAQVESAWTNFKTKITRHIPILPDRSDEKSLRLSLPNSNAYLDNLIALPRLEQRGLAPIHQPPPSDGTMEQVTMFTDRYFQLAAGEMLIEKERVPVSNDSGHCQRRCLDLANSIPNLLTEVGDAYDSNPEQISIFVLNVFDLWVQMDKCALVACPLLQDYAPVFKPELLDVLQLPTLSNMQRLREIQKHLQSRRLESKFGEKTFFSGTREDSFAVRYVQQSQHLRDLQRQIETASNKARGAKKSEWNNACQEYDSRTEKIASGTCTCSFNPDGTRNVKGCTKCWHVRCRKRMKLSIHEDFLPAKEAQKAAVVFELGIPSFFAAYRNATFKILSTLGHPSRPQTSPPPVMLLKDYSQLSGYMKSNTHGVSLASAKKSFLQTHFKAVKMKADLSHIIHPLGLEFQYYDTNSNVWLKDLFMPLTFQHLCGVHIPRSLQLVIPSTAHPAPSMDNRSSYEIIASQTKCPPDISIHEFTSYQKLLSGNSCRWLTMLVELGASNLNFSAEDTMHLFNHLAVQAGPVGSGKEDEILGSTHEVFRDRSFCQRLAEQIDNRLRNIITNWREVYCMEMLITLSLRLFSLTSGRERESAENLLRMARKATLQWIFRLRDEIRNATEADTAERAANYGFWAALLCRRTFATFVETRSVMGGEDLSSFVQASVALQENLVVDLGKLPLTLKNVLARDMKMARYLRLNIIRSIESNLNSLGSAINQTWADASNSVNRTYSPWKFLTTPYERWVTSIITSEAYGYIVSQVVHYNFVEGHLLVDRRPLARLPLNIRESKEVKELFGNQHLLTFPSGVPGMTHRMATLMEGNEIHFGLRGQQVVIRARTNDNLLEYVPRNVFTNGETFDLPLGLIEDCVHWLNLRTGQLEIRRKPSIWRTRQSDWALDVENRRARRKNVFLVDPRSDLCQSVASVFHHFEDPNRLTVFQPIAMNGKLSVELRHLELSFFVNRNCLLQCQELRAEIDPNQDCGTLYGFQSGIVLRDVDNIERRSMITPLGPLSYKLHGMHVVVKASSSNDYARFGIDDVLGRLSCPPEPRLLYSKALLHAYTSFVLPDPLTGRTGTEEALHTLRSGHSQPWKPLTDGVMPILKAIQCLSPTREYYPKDKKRLQTVTWDQRLNTTIQHESYEPLVRGILAKSNRLQVFNTTRGDPLIQLDAEEPTHLQERAEIRRLLYERDNPDVPTPARTNDLVYIPRDREVSLSQATNVYRIAKLIRKQPFSSHQPKTLSAILQRWSLIGGFPHRRGRGLESTSGSLSDLIESDICEQWGSLMDNCRRTDPEDYYNLVFRLGMLSFADKPDMEAIESLAAFACVDQLKELVPPSGSSFAHFKLSEAPTVESLVGLMAEDFPVVKTFTRKGKVQRDPVAESARNRCEAEGRRLAELLLEQWPCVEPSGEDFESDIIDVELAMEKVVPEWERMYSNLDLSRYVMEAQDILHDRRGPKDISVPRSWGKDVTVFSAPYRGTVIPSLSKELLLRSGPISVNSSTLHQETLSSGTGLQNGYLTQGTVSTSKWPARPSEANELKWILDSFARSQDALRQQYSNDLKKSLIALENVTAQPKVQTTPPTIFFIRDEIKNTRKLLNNVFPQILDALSVAEERFKWLHLGTLWPLITPVTILEQLRSSSNHEFGKNMKESLVYYGVVITKLQRLLRIRHTQLKNDQAKLHEELGNIGHQNWNPLEFADWLLLEIECDLLIREEQIEVAYAIISPASNSNSVLQMNMGKGKTSCIVPMVMAILADTKQLARLIVPKALLLQTAQTLQSRLGGLVGREIRHIPFSRTTSTTPEMLRLYTDHHYEIYKCSGVLLTNPEHVLSYKLSGLQRLADSKFHEAQEMVKFQAWLTKTCRDVLDESDFTLAVKTQLIYPSGPQISVDGHPHRWEVVQILLSLVEDHLVGLRQDFPRSIEVDPRPGGFPMIHLLQADVENALHQRITNDICNGRISFLRLVGPDPVAASKALRRILTEEELDQNLLAWVCNSFADNTRARKIILLLRGLIVDRILLLCLKKRWNVQYGLHPNRDPIAVPFEAKGVPSEQAEFGHPDVSIIFTCLAFYYSGVTLAQLGEGLQHVLKSDDPAAEYDRWTYGSATLPENLRHWNVINGDDKGQLEELLRHLRVSRNVLDHYMNHFVFPLHAKQFGIKLQASGWDLPLFSKTQPGEKSAGARTTGFSGTNDNKMMLPLNIRQDDLPSLSQTNAEVLTYLLAPRNRNYIRAAWDGKRLTEEGLLRRLKREDIKILIDAGAHVLEMNNETLVTKWLEIYPNANGAVYFGDDNRAWVKYRGGKKPVPLLATPFADNLNKCLVYIDEAHTRGIDLKLPQDARGALTLALGQTKDHTVQAAMRLRQLGTTQSVTFFAPPEVHQSILDVCETTTRFVDSSHVVTWLLEQTCRANEHLQNLYVSQGIDFCRRTNAQWTNPRFLADKAHRESFLDVIQQPELQTLEQLYGVPDTQPHTLAEVSSLQLKPFVDELIMQRRASRANGKGAHSSVLQEVEQEREVEFQVEEVRQIQKRTHYDAHVFPGLREEVSRFAKTGELYGEGGGFEHAFEALARTNIGKKHDLHFNNSGLYVSAEFSRTIKVTGKKTPKDNFLRPVEFILWSPKFEEALIVIPEEAELLISILRAAKKPKCHLIAYAAPVTKNMAHFNGLSYYVVPRLPTNYKFPDWLSIELGIVAGRLYFDFSERATLMKYLQLDTETNPNSSGSSDTDTPTEASNSGSSSEQALVLPAKNPVNFLLEWLTLCRKGQDIMHTPMGYVCQGRPLHEGHPFFLKRGDVDGFVLVGGGSGSGEGSGSDTPDVDVDSDFEYEYDCGAVI